MNQNNKFVFEDKEMDFGIVELWEQKYSNIYNMQETIAEFLVERALGLEKSFNSDYWTLYDILYRDYRIEVKETGYYHPWNEEGNISLQRVFGITKANSNYEDNTKENKYERQNDIYVFCLNTGKDKETSNPMNINNWKFYIIPTAVINKQCGNNKTISLNRVKNLAREVQYNEIKEVIDNIIDNSIFRGEK
ncbi:MAG: hypothetical protein J6A15_03360 [Clostridia bacterium]|nr:hypothetical protein [Clostridia bacterium]